MYDNKIFQLSKSQTLRRRADNAEVKPRMLSALFCFITNDNSLPRPTGKRKKTVAGQVDFVRLFYITSGGFVKTRPPFSF